MKNGKYRTAIRSARRRERLDKLEKRELFVLIETVRKVGSEYEPEIIDFDKWDKKSRCTFNEIEQLRFLVGF